MNSICDIEEYNRQSIRLKGYDYTLPGAYFVTILSNKRACLFGEVDREDIVQSVIGHVVEECWVNILNNNPYIRLDEYVIMPNHLHGIIFLLEADGKGEAFSAMNATLDDPNSENASPLRPRGTHSGSLSAVIQNFKSISTRLINKRFFEPGTKIWQRNYYERIIRNESELKAIRQYIIDNPMNWNKDKENPTNKDT